MPLGYEYKRYFIILQEEDKGYEMTAGKIPTGYVKIEIKKNRVKVGGFIQNMKSDTKSKYKLNLLAPRQKLVLDIGLFRMDGAGRGEFYAEFDSDNVSGSNLSISEFTGALVVAGSGIPMVGYAGRDSIPWRDWYGKEDKEEAEKIREEEMPEKESVTEELPRIERIEAAEDIEEARTEELLRIEKIEAAEDIEEAREIEDMVWQEETRGQGEAQEAEEIVKIEEARKEDAEEILEAREVHESSKVEERIEKEDGAESAEVFEAAREEILESESEIIDMEMRAEPAPLYYEEPEYAEQQSFHGWDTGRLTNEVQEPERHKKEHKESEEKAHKIMADALKCMEKFGGFHDEYGIRWYRIGQELPLLNDVMIPINGAMMPLSYPYIAESAGRNIESCVLGIEYRKGEIRYVYIGIPGAYYEGCKACYEYKGFTGYKRTRDNRRGYWIMCMDIMKGKICRI